MAGKSRRVCNCFEWNARLARGTNGRSEAMVDEGQRKQVYVVCNFPVRTFGKRDAGSKAALHETLGPSARDSAPTFA